MRMFLRDDTVHVPNGAALDETGERPTEEQLCMLRTLRGFLLTASDEAKTAVMHMVVDREGSCCAPDARAIDQAEQMGRALGAVMKIATRKN